MPAPPNAPYRVAHVVIRPRTRAELTLSLADAGAAIQRSFGAACVAVTGVSTRDDAWTATIALDASKAPLSADVKLLLANAQDERLWRTFIEASFAGNGTCSVVELEAAASLAADAPRAR